MKPITAIPLLVAIIVLLLPFSKPTLQSDSAERFISYLTHRSGHKRSSSPKYKPLCEVEVKQIDLRDDPYHISPFYHEYFCTTPENAVSSDDVQKCGIGKHFHCVQQYEDIYILKEDPNNPGCVQAERKTIASGCDCMWPTFELIQ